MRLRARVDSIAEVLSAQGKAVGVVSTARLTHATPASVYAHAADRNFEDDSKLPEGCTTPDIASQLVTAFKTALFLSPWAADVAGSLMKHTML